MARNINTVTEWRRKFSKDAKEFSGNIFKRFGSTARQLASDKSDDEELGRALYTMFLGAKSAIFDPFSQEILMGCEYDTGEWL